MYKEENVDSWLQSFSSGKSSLKQNANKPTQTPTKAFPYVIRGNKIKYDKSAMFLHCFIFQAVSQYGWHNQQQRVRELYLFVFPLPSIPGHTNFILHSVELYLLNVHTERIWLVWHSQHSAGGWVGWTTFHAVAGGGGGVKENKYYVKMCQEKLLNMNYMDPVCAHIIRTREWKMCRPNPIGGLAFFAVVIPSARLRRNFV